MSIDLGGGLQVSGAGAASTSTAALTQAAWFVDPANVSGLASDKNSGATALLPLLTFKEIQKRWTAAAMNYGGFDGFIPILQNIVVTYLSSPPTPLTDPIKLSVERYGGANLSFTYAPAVTKTSTILALTTSRGGANSWRITSTAGFVAGDAGKAFVNTTRGTYSTIVAVAGGIADITEPLANQTVVNPASSAPALTSPQAGDTYTIVDVCRAKLLGVYIRQVATDSSQFLRAAVSFLNFSWVQTLNPFGTGNPDSIVVQGNMTGIGLNASGATFSQCNFDGNLSVIGAYVQVINSTIGGSSTCNNGRLTVNGGLESGIVANGSNIIVDGYCLVKGRVGDQQATQPSVILIGLACLYGGIQDCFTSEVKSQIRLVQANYFSLTPNICGTCTRYVFRLVNGGLLLNSTAAPLWGTLVTATFGTFMANESTPCNMLAYTQATLLFGALYEVTIANLDDPAKLAGCAVDPGTGSSVRPFSSH